MLIIPLFTEVEVTRSQQVARWFPTNEVSGSVMSLSYTSQIKFIFGESEINMSSSSWCNKITGLKGECMSKSSWKKHSKIAKRCPEYISSVVEVLSCSYPKAVLSLVSNWVVRIWVFFLVFSQFLFEFWSNVNFWVILLIKFLVFCCYLSFYWWNKKIVWRKNCCWKLFSD